MWSETCQPKIVSLAFIHRTIPHSFRGKAAETGFGVANVFLSWGWSVTEQELWGIYLANSAQTWPKGYRAGWHLQRAFWEDIMLGRVSAKHQPNIKCFVLLVGN